MIQLLFAAALSVAVQGTGAETPTLAWSRHALPNGLDVVLAPDASATEVAVELWVRVGARHEWPGRFGLAHFFEHAMPWGYGFARTPRGRALLDSLGTNSNALTRYDYTRYYRQTLADGLDLFLLAAADRLAADPAREISAAHVEAHRVNVAAEIGRQAAGTWGWPVKNRLQAGAYGSHHPYGHAIYGSEADTRDVTPDDMRRWFRAHLRPEYTTLIVVGRFEPEAALAMITRMFGGIPGGERAPPAAEVPAVASGRDTVTIASEEAHAIRSYAVPAWRHEDNAALSLLGRILTDRMARERPASVTEAEAKTELWELAGRFGVAVAFTDERQRSSVTRWLDRLVADLTARGVTEAELAAARATSVAQARETMALLGWQGSRAGLLGEGVIYADDPGAWRALLQHEARVTPGEALAVARRWLAGSYHELAVRRGQ